MKASVVLPAWNEEKRIGACIQSLQRQTFKDFECIVIDDGSTDSTYEAAMQAINGDARFEVHLTSNEGLSAARNYALKLASGEYVFYVDADDIPHENFLAEPIKFLDETRCDIVFFEAELANEGLNDIDFNKERRYFHRNGSYGVLPGSKLLQYMEGIGDFIAPVYLQAIERNAIKYKFQKGMLYEDELYTVQNLLLAKTAGHLKKTLYTRTCRKGSIVQSKKTILHSASKWKSGTLMKQFIQSVASGLTANEIKAVENIANRCILFAAKIWKSIPEEDKDIPSILTECEKTEYAESMKMLSQGFYSL